MEETIQNEQEREGMKEGRSEGGRIIVVSMKRRGKCGMGNKSVGVKEKGEERNICRRRECNFGKQQISFPRHVLGRFSVLCLSLKNGPNIFGLRRYIDHQMLLVQIV